MENKLVSVNITTYNRGNILSRCIDSILSQTYDNIELIIVDDCSQDNTQEVVQSYQKKDSRITYIQHDKNQGNASARNTAFSYGKGTYIAFMDDDDEWIDKNKLLKQISIFENSQDDLGFVCCGIIRLNEQNQETIEYASEPNNLIETVLSGGLLHNSTVLTTRKIVQKVGAFDVNMPRGVDSDFFRRAIVLYGYRVKFMNDVMVKYYENVSIRMTDSKNISSLKKDIASNELCLKKFKKEFKYYKKAFIRRKQRYIRTYIKLLCKEFSFKTMFELFKFVLK